MHTTRIHRGAVLLLLAAALPARAAQETQGRADELLARDDRIAELERQVAVLVDEVSSLRTGMAVPEEPELTSAFGQGPAASRIYGASRGLSIGGYAEAVYRNRVGDAPGDDLADLVRMVTYLGYRFSDRLLFHTELELEHATTEGAGAVSVEQASLEYLLRDELSFRAGLLLVPVGLVNEIHEPPFFYGTQRPTPERTLLPSTWREPGVGIFGNLGESVSYRLYLVSGLDASGFRSSGLRGGRQQGSEARAEDLAVVARLDLHPLQGLLVGFSFYQGRSGRNGSSPSGGTLPDTRVRIWEAHGDWERGPLRARGLLGWASIGNAGDLSTALGLAGGEPVAEEMIAGYLEAGYDLMSFLAPGSEKSLTPFFRFEYVDTQRDVPAGYTRDRSQPRRILIPGIQFKPHPNVVLKLDYRNIDTWGSSAADEVSLGFGLVF